jgi:hypothetical protein
MHGTTRGLVLVGIVSWLLLAAGALQAKPWRDIESFPASRIRWMGLSGTDGDDRTHLYSIKAQGSLFKPYPQKPPFPANVQAYVQTWLSKHPRAQVIPVEAYPFLSASVARVYVWIVDGDENLNLHLVAEGFFRGSTQVPMLRTADLLVSAQEAGAFRKQAAIAEIAAAEAGKGIWRQDDRDPGMPPGRLGFPGIQSLAELEEMAEKAPEPKPPLSYGPEKPEADLLHIFFGDDGPASYAAREELLRRAESGELSRKAFSSLIAVGLDRQFLESWDPFCGTLIHLAFQQGKLTETLLKRYARQAISLDFQVKASVLEPNTPIVDFTIRRKRRFARARTPKMIENSARPQLLITTAFRLGQVEVDGAPALNGRTGKRLDQTWLFQAWRGNKVQPVAIMTDPPVAPGPHSLTGVLFVRYMPGVGAWNAAGKREALPDGLPILLEERYDIDLKFTMSDY